MEQSDFITRLAEWFLNSLKMAERDAEAQIEGERHVLDEASFWDWMKQERDNLRSTQGRPFYNRLRKSGHYDTPESAARTLAGYINMDQMPEPVNWESEWKDATYLLAYYRNSTKDKSRWKYGSQLLAYFIPAIAGAKAQVFSGYIGKNKQAEPEVAPVTVHHTTSVTYITIPEPPAQVAPETVPEPLTFEGLFKSDSLAAWAYQLAVDVGMIYGKGRWGKKWREGAIVIYWEFLKEIPESITEQVNDNMAIDAISAHFGKSVSDRTRRGMPKYRDDLRRALKAAKKDLPV